MTPADAILMYIRAKDGNRPHLLEAAFDANATLRMEVRTEAISFPAESIGRDAIAQTLVRQFNQSYENIYTFCLGAPPDLHATACSCAWLVGMSAREGGAVRVGCGRYDWTFGPADPKARALVITIDAMEVLAPDTLAPVLAWLAGLPYPWCGKQAALQAAPGIPGVQRVLQVLSHPLP